MFEFMKNNNLPIGVDMGDDILKLAQLKNGADGITLAAGGTEKRPVDVNPGTSAWQRWAIEALKKMTSNGKFKGRKVTATIPASEVFIDHVRAPVTSNDKLSEVVYSKVKQKLPFSIDEAMIKYIPAENDYVVVIATERTKIDRHLAIYEKANLQIQSIAAWPVALANSYVKFFGRRKTDLETVVALLDVEARSTNVVITRHKNLLFARAIPIGAKDLFADEKIARLVLELTACKRQFESMYRKTPIERIIFLSGNTLEREICALIAKQLEMPAQIGDCLAAVQVANPYEAGIDRRECKFSWATAFGLSLS